jgi:DNA-binding transcriptional MocR family regulator
VGSLSKLFWGGMRIGWVRADADVVRRLTVALARTTMADAVVEQLAACVLLDGLDAAREGVRDRLRERRAALLGALAERLPDWRVPTPPGGLFVWCALPGPRSSALVLEAERVGVRLAAGPLFGTGHALEDRLRLPFAQPPELLRRAVDLLARADARAGGRRDPAPAEATDVLTVS